MQEEEEEEEAAHCGHLQLRTAGLPAGLESIKYIYSSVLLLIFIFCYFKLLLSGTFYCTSLNLLDLIMLVISYFADLDN